MLTIALDETGQFDKLQEPLKLIGGLAYTANDRQEAEERLFQKITQLCQHHQLRFPNDLHGNSIAPSVRQKLLVELLSFLKQEKHYQLVGILKSPQPLSQERDFSNLTQEIGNNLYESMSLRLLYNLLFFNPAFDTKTDFALHIAKRSMEVPASDKDRVQLYEQFGYDSKYDEQNEKYRYYLTNNNTFKSALTTKLQEISNKRPLTCDIKALSIDYKTQDRLKQNAFLYAADLICSYFRDKLDSDYPDFKIAALQKELTKFKLPLMLFIYDDIDEQWVSCYKAYIEHNYFKTLASIYDFQKSSSRFAKHYYQSFVMNIEKNIHTLFEIARLPTYLSELEYYLEKRSLKDHYPLNKIIFLGESIWQITQDYSEPSNQKYKYALADLLIRAYNHQGDVEKADDYYAQCQQLREYASPIDYCATGLIIAQTSVNNFHFQAAIELIQERIPLLLDLKMLQQKIATELEQQNPNNKYPLLGKFYSSLGQLYTFIKRFDKAKIAFEQAIAEFETKRDISFTSALIAHLAIEMNDLAAFHHYAKDAFGSSTINGYWNKTLEHHNTYHAYAFLKAAHQFKWSLDEELLHSISAFISNNTSTDHPWALIYKHAAFVFQQHQQVDQAHAAIKKISEIHRSKTTSDQILEIMAELCYLHQFDAQAPKIEKLYKQLMNICERKDGLRTYFEPLLMTPIELRGQSLNDYVSYIHA